MFRLIPIRRPARPRTPQDNRPTPAPSPSSPPPDTRPADDTCPAPADEPVGRMIRYEAPLQIDGVVRVCPDCGVDRDWLLLNSGDHVWRRCRSGHEHYEPTLDAAWFNQYCGPVKAVHASRDAGLLAMGFDGTFAGVIL